MNFITMNNLSIEQKSYILDILLYVQAEGLVLPGCNEDVHDEIVTWFEKDLKTNKD